MEKMYQSYSSMMFNMTDTCCSMDGPNWKNMEWSSWKPERHGANKVMTHKRWQKTLMLICSNLFAVL